ncbi:hypothetical protein BDZ45DRAFT_748704 [Acephala macrosclerotiorum]|nr:hypothetical protein BDZ45DRAFT_748704 [Acephala macrosclerotiorum]
MNLLTLLLLLVTFISMTSTSPLQLRKVNDVLEGYTMTKLGYNATINGEVVSFQGDSVQHIYEQVKAADPTFQIPYSANATEYKNRVAKQQGHVSHTAGIDRRSQNPIWGPNWRAYCMPVPGNEQWNVGNRGNFEAYLYAWEGDYNQFYISDRSCALIVCVGGDGWTVCNDSYDNISLFSYDWFTQMGFALMNVCGTYFNDFNEADGGQIFETVGPPLNWIAASNFNGCYGETFQ